MGAFFSHEYFEDKLRRPPLCCGGGNQALNWAERIDGYVAACERSPINSKAREGATYQASIYTQETLAVPLEESDSPWPNGQVIWMEPAADGGLPHTRPPYYICLSPSIDLTKPAGRATLTHERIHVSQRLHQAKWATIYSEVWNYVELDLPPILPKELRDRVRINPDTHGAPTYAWQGEWVAYALFNSTFAPKLTDISIYWWHIPSKNAYKTPPPGYAAFFGADLNASAYEHPNELAAYLLTSNVWSPARTALEKKLGDLPRGETW